MSDDPDEEELYDEFGNYIGPDLNDDDEDEDDSDADDDEASNGSGEQPRPPRDTMVVTGNPQNDNDDDDDDDDDDTTLAWQQQQQIVLHEDKEHYPSAEQVFGDHVQTVLLDEDAMDLDTPLVEPLSTKQHTVFSTTNNTQSSSSSSKTQSPVTWNYSDDYLAVHLSNETTRTRRGVAIVGHFAHGKTSLVDLILESTLLDFDDTNNGEKENKSKSSRGGTWGPRASLDAGAGGGPRFTDTLKSEQERQMSLVGTPVTCLLPDTRGKTICVTAVDCPGHPQFHDESVAALRAMDGAVLVVDVVEGVQMHTEMCIRQAVTEGVPIVLVLSKLDRLIVELKLPPSDAYYKLLNVIESVHAVVQQASRGRYPPISPARGNVAFSSAQHGYLFTVQSFAMVLAEQFNGSDESVGDGEANSNKLGCNLSVEELGARLWGDCFLDPTTRQFQSSARDCGRSADGNGSNSAAIGSGSVKRTFVQFVLEPIYKIYSACLGEREPVTNQLLRSVGVLLSKDQLRASARPLLRMAMSKFLQSALPGWVDMIVQQVPHPMAAAAGKIARCYSGPVDTDSAVMKAMKECDPRGPLVIHCVKNFASSDGQTFWTFGRIYSGTIRPAETVKILGEGYSPEDDEDVAVGMVTGIAIPRGRCYTNVSMAKAGNWVLLEGVDSNIAKTATIVSNDLSDEEMCELHTFSPLKFPHAGGEAIMKLAIEPLNPAELPKMVEGLRRVSKAYPMSRTKVEESGEHIVLGTGELYMDCLMYDLRNVYSDIEVKIADPIVSFRETVVDTSSLKCFAETANKRNKLTFIAESMDDGLAEQLEAGVVNPKWDVKKQGHFFQSKFNWDLLSSRSVWAFGDSPTHGTNLLMDDTLPGEVDKSLLDSCRSSIIQGFQWAMREGPLCEEPVRGTKIKIIDVTLAEKAIFRGGGQLIPTVRRTVHSSLLTATPRLMEPMYRLDIQCPGSIVDSIQPILTRRRGHIVQDRPVSGTTLFSVKGFIPVLDSFGFETDLRTFTQGQAMVYAVFDHWAIVPGDPIDRSIVLYPLEPSPQQHLARELLVKTRRRKGLSDDVSISKFFDEGIKNFIAQQTDFSAVD